MFGSSMFDIAIGVVFTFLLLSIFATAINEMIASAFTKRGAYLLRGIQALLNDKAGTGLVQQVYTSGQIYGLFEGLFDPTKPQNLPSYIPSKNFALALITTVEQFAAPGPLTQTAGQMSSAFLSGVQKLAADPATEKVGKPLLSLIETSEADAAKVQQGIEDWFNSSMDRVSGWYKHHTQKCLFAIGIVMAVALNANTVNIVQHLAKDPTLRQTIVAAAKNAPNPSSTTPQDTQQRIQAASDTLAQATTLGIPIGWCKENLPGVAFNPKPAFGFGTACMLLLGWILTAVAVSVGAPFWFDALNRIMVIRSTVKPAEKSPSEKSKS